MNHAAEFIGTLCMRILCWCLYRYYCVGAQLRIFVFLVGWFLHNILLSLCSNEEIGVSSRLFPTCVVELVLS